MSQGCGKRTARRHNHSPNADFANPMSALQYKSVARKQMYKSSTGFQERRNPFTRVLNVARKSQIGGELQNPKAAIIHPQFGGSGLSMLLHILARVGNPELTPVTQRPLKVVRLSRRHQSKLEKGTLQPKPESGAPRRVLFSPNGCQGLTCWSAPALLFSPFLGTPMPLI